MIKTSADSGTGGPAAGDVLGIEVILSRAGQEVEIAAFGSSRFFDSGKSG
jgi:hypothetical protein